MVNDIVDIDRYNIKRLIVLFNSINKRQYSIRLKNTDTVSPIPSRRLYRRWEQQRENVDFISLVECLPICYRDKVIITFIRDESFTKIIVNKNIHSHLNWVRYSKLLLNKNEYFNFDTL